METIVMLLFGVSLAVLLAVRCNTLLVYFQQEEYDDNRFFNAWQSVRLFDVIASCATLLLLLTAGMLGITTPALLLLAAVYLALAWREQRYAFKKPLVNTERVRRLRACAMVPLLLLALLASWFTWLAVVVLQLVPLMLVLANKVLQPAQQRVNERFIQQARGRLAESNAVAIGVTGSFGKTTVKHMLADMLSVAGPVFYSRGSVNTILGLTRHIRQRLQPAHRYFVAEMGAYQIGSINRLCEFVKPAYGIVTAVGEAHAERFGSIENTAIAKAELADWVCRYGTTLVTTEAVIALKPFAQLRQQHPEKFVVVGYEPGCDVRISDSRLTDGKWQIALEFATSPRFEYALPLLGDHNILNSALAVALLENIDAALLTRLAPKMADLEQVAHRLELREAPGEPVVLDDAYNSNEQGFSNAVEVLHQLAAERGGRAVLVTPGIAELGDEHDDVHRRLGMHCSKNCDVVFVVNPERVPTFVNALGDSSVNMITVASLVEARSELAKLELSQRDVVLYENDLPDLLEEKRLL